ncbi:MAG: hypothetical protein PHT07_08680 [Paludibacter sp.]|nr:hypothetical protein [Paludibacter sp.]
MSNDYSKTQTFSTINLIMISALTASTYLDQPYTRFFEPIIENVYPHDATMYNNESTNSLFSEYQQIEENISDFKYLLNFSNKIAENSKNIEPRFVKMVDEFFWDLV